jgi:hypothetical protein
MGAIDNGTQIILWDYKQAIDSSEINKTFYKILSPGVYDGGTLTISSGDDILIAPLQVMVETSTNQLIKISTTSNATLTLAEITPYVTCQFSWADSETNYMDFTAKAFGDITTNDIVLGMGVYVGGVLTSFDYSYKTWGDKPYILDSSITLNVGTGGQFTTINDAIEYAWSNYYPAYVKGGILVTINLLSGFIMSEQLLVTGLDMSWIRITGDDAETTISCASLTQSFRGVYPAFGVARGVLPVISHLFTMDSSGTPVATNHGIALFLNSYCYIATGGGVKNPAGTGLYVNNSSFYCTNAIFTGAGVHGLYLTACSNGFATNSDFSNAVQNGIAVYASNLNMNACTATGCTGQGLLVDQNSKVTAQTVCTFSSIGSHGVNIREGSIVSLEQANISSSANNALSISNSFVYANSAVINCTSATVTYNGVVILSGSHVDLTSASVTASGGHGIYCASGSRCCALSSTSTPGSGSYYGYRIATGGIISANGATGTLSNTANAISSSGIIFQ